MCIKRSIYWGIHNKHNINITQSPHTVCVQTASPSAEASIVNITHHSGSSASPSALVSIWMLVPGSHVQLQVTLLKHPSEPSGVFTCIYKSLCRSICLNSTMFTCNPQVSVETSIWTSEIAILVLDSLGFEHLHCVHNTNFQFACGKFYHAFSFLLLECTTENSWRFPGKSGNFS